MRAFIIAHIYFVCNMGMYYLAKCRRWNRYYGYLLDQLELIERLEMVIEDNNIEAVKKQLALERKFVERKLYQKPPIKNE